MRNERKKSVWPVLIGTVIGTVIGIAIWLAMVADAKRAYREGYEFGKIGIPPNNTEVGGMAREAWQRGYLDAARDYKGKTWIIHEEK